MQQLSAQSETERRLQRLSAVKQSQAIGREELARLEEEIRQQDVILTGYQRDNERLHGEMKHLRSTAKATEERMFHENHKLKSQLANLRSASLSHLLWFHPVFVQ